MGISERTKETDGHGGFTRQQNSFTTPFGDGEGELPVEAGRYRLIVAKICPWAHRQLIARELLGLQDAISVGVAGPRRTLNGWRFYLDEGNKDPVLGIEYLIEAYEAADPTYSKRGTVPAIVDVTTGKVVNNNYHRMTNELEVKWEKLHAPGAPDLYPADKREQIDEFNEWLFNNVNNGVYKCGFATTQAAYDAAHDNLFAALDKLEECLATKRFLWGDYITDSDIRLYVTLARFDAAYYGGFKANRQRLVDFHHLWDYARDLYQTPGFGSTTDFEAIKEGYFGGEGVIGEGEPIIPKGPDQSGWELPHDRARLSSDPDNKFLAKS
ncbi:glutathione S-transferase family protein [Corynebacterium vitaeruminis]|uniref:Glutathione S-transferase n=1 Tax=Corynebacterium vitaeruminis DSM 20294 TaxID=1224164 RepID=W5XWQ2_9CORY|nr:glutathione S-transferase C-terminal domain-containing protein [Corynebacterium vitaeruminis]AHI21436.1 glutathione S-transferase [Corynebacterium vitaeruminis DSM 20294]